MKKDGVTIIEIVIVMVLVSVFSLGFASFLSTGINAWQFLRLRESALSQADAAMNRMIKELRVATPPSDSIPYVFTWAEYNAVEFYDYAGVKKAFKVYTEEGDYSKSRVVIVLNPKAPNESVHTLANYVDSGSGLNFKYYDDRMNELVSPVIGDDMAKIRYVKIVVSVYNENQTVTIMDGARIRVIRRGYDS